MPLNADFNYINNERYNLATVPETCYIQKTFIEEAAPVSKQLRRIKSYPDIISSSAENVVYDKQNDHIFAGPRNLCDQAFRYIEERFMSLEEVLHTVFACWESNIKHGTPCNYEATYYPQSWSSKIEVYNRLRLYGMSPKKRRLPRGRTTAKHRTFSARICCVAAACGIPPQLLTICKIKNPRIESTCHQVQDIVKRACDFYAKTHEVSEYFEIVFILLPNHGIYWMNCSGMRQLHITCLLEIVEKRPMVPIITAMKMEHYVTNWAIANVINSKAVNWTPGQCYIEHWTGVFCAMFENVADIQCYIQHWTNVYCEIFENVSDRIYSAI